MAHLENLGGRAFNGLCWSIARSWGGKAVNLLLYLILARLLNPAQFGIAAAVALVLMLQHLIAEFGFGDALIQRAQLPEQDITLPFLAGVSSSVVLSVAIALFSHRIERLINVPGLAPYLTVASLFAPLAAATAFQEALYKRDLDFMPLAIRQFVALAVSGVIGVCCAFSGMGAWSLIVQSVIYTIVSSLWLWRKPRWKPIRRYDWVSFRAIGTFGASIFSTRLIDFFATRAIEFVIVTMHGAAALGLYSIGAKLYQTAMDLLFRTVMDVSLSALSKIAHDRARLAVTYRRVVSASSMVGTPAFFAMAALSPEITHILFGGKWAGSELIMAPLMLIGGVQCIQFVNGSYLTALGRPHLTLWLTLIKLAAVLPAIILIPSGTVDKLVDIYVLALLVVTPFTFALVAKELGIRLQDIVKWIAPGLSSAGAAYSSVWLVRRMVGAGGMNAVAQLFAFGLLFTAVYLVSILLMGRSSVREAVGFIRRRA